MAKLDVLVHEIHITGSKLIFLASQESGEIIKVTKAGSPRFRCYDCKKIFTISDRPRGKPRSPNAMSNAKRQRLWRLRNEIDRIIKED